MTELTMKNARALRPITQLLAALLATSALAAAAADPVGYTKGEFSVDPTGAANYKIPLWVPPGVAGMQPQLALQYASRGSNGHLGIGWALGGLSAITRCPMTKSVDGGSATPDGLDYDVNDRLCLDGKRLLAPAGQGYWAASEYSPELASFELIKAIGPETGNFTAPLLMSDQRFQNMTVTSTAADGAPSGFTVLDKSGLVRYYGAASASTTAADSQIQLKGLASGANVVAIWPLKRIQDRHGNYIEFQYGESVDSTEYWIERITYFGATGFQAGRVDFDYVDGRPDASVGFAVRGTQVTLRKRMSAIKAHARNTLVRVYKLSYDQHPDSAISRLAQVQECAGYGACLRPTQFDYDSGVAGFLAAKNLGANMDFHKLADVNGDGRTDVIWDDDNNIHLTWNYTGSTQIHSIHTGPDRALQLSVVTDFDGDGKTDLLIPSVQPFPFGGGDRNWEWLQGSDSGLTNRGVVAPTLGGYAARPAPFALDINDDNLPEIFFRDGNTLHYYARSSGTTIQQTAIDTGIDVGGATQIHPGDFNGDGRTDLLLATGPNQDGTGCWDVTCSGDTGIFLGNGSGFERWIVDVPPSVMGSALRGVYTLDFNGDGLTDLLTNERLFASTVHVWYLHENTGNGFAAARGVPGLGYLSDSDNQTEAPDYSAAVRPVDYNGDGRSDILFPKNGNWYVKLSNGTNLWTEVNTGRSHAGTHANGSELADFNGDGIMDLMEYPGGDNVWWAYFGNFVANGQLSRVTDGVGSTVDIGYRALSQKDPDGTASSSKLYQGHTTSGMGQATCVAPNCIDFLGPIEVVREFFMDSGVRAADGSAVQIHTTYHYSGAKIDKRGRGFLGFRSIYATNSNSGTYTENLHRQDFPFLGMIESATRRTAGTPLQEVALRPRPLTRGCIDRITNVLEPGAVCEEGEVLEAPDNTGTVSITTNTLASFTLASPPNGTFPYAAKVGVFPYVATSSTSHHRYDVSNSPIYKRESSTKTYDACGNVLTNIESTTNAAGGDEHRVSTTNKFMDIGSEFGTLTPAACLGKLVSVVSVHSAAPGEAGAIPDLTRSVRFSYDGTSSESDTLDLIEKVVQPGSPLALTTQYTYDRFGNSESETVNGAGLTPRQSHTQFDENGQFAIRSTNPLGQSESRQWDWMLETLRAHTGPNGLTTTYGYDEFGRQVWQQSPQAAARSRSELGWCTAGVCRHASAVYWSKRFAMAGSNAQQPVEKQVAWTEFDSLGRVVLTKAPTMAERVANAAEPMYREAIVEHHFDLAGHEYATSAPYFDVAGAARGWTVKAFDSLDRVTAEYSNAYANGCSALSGTAPPSYLGGSSRIANAAVETACPGSHAGLRRTRILHAGLATVITDAENHTSEKLVDVGGHLVRSRDIASTYPVEDGAPLTNPNGTGTLETRYAYDAVGNATWAKPPHGRVTQIGYNDRNFKVSMSDPDMGNWSYSYNAVGELISQTDQKAQVATLAYDALGRLVTRDEAEGRTSWTYDTGYGRGVGKSAYVVGPDGYAEVYAYDEFGALTDTIRVIDDELFWVSQTYDALGRPSVLVYPDIAGFDGDTAPNAPAFVGVPSSSNGTHDLAWTDTSDYAVYHLYRATSDTRTQATEIYVGPSATFRDRVGQDLTFSYWVKACHGEHCSSETGPVHVEVSLPPSAPDYLRVDDYDAQHDRQLAFAWGRSDKHAAGASYRLYQRRESQGFSTEQLVYSGVGTTVGVGNDQHQILTLTVPGDDVYSYSIEACIGAVCSGRRVADSSARVELTPPAPVSISVPTYSSSTAFTVGWIAPVATPADRYVVDRYDVERTVWLHDPYSPATQSGSALCSLSAVHLTPSYAGPALSAGSGLGAAQYGNYCYRVRACRVTAQFESCSAFVISDRVATGPTPTPVTGVSLPLVGPGGGYLLDWADNATAAWYAVQEATDAGFTQNLVSYVQDAEDCTAWEPADEADPNGPQVCTTSVLRTNLTFSGKGNGTRFYRVAACTNVICGPWTAAPNSVTVSLPPAPTGTVSLPAGYDIDGSFDVLWGASPSAGTGGAFTHYELMESNNGGDVYAPWVAVSPNPTTATKPIVGKTDGVYWYRVRACNTAAACSAWAYSTSGVQVVTPPAAPSSIAVPTSSTTGNYTVSWSPSTTSGVDEYRVWEATNSAFTSATIIFAGSTEVCTQSHTNQEGEVICTQSHMELDTMIGRAGMPNGTYWYRVQACKLGVCSAYTGGASNSISVLLPPTAPAAPVPSTAFTTTGAYNVTWTAPSGPVSSYTLYENGASISPNAVSPYAFSGKGNGSYGYKVVACNASGCSAQSASSVSVLVELAPGLPGVPGTSPNPVNSGSYTVTWSAASGTVTAYELQEGSSSSGPWTTVYTGTLLSKAITGKADNSLNWYQVRACNGGTCSTYRQGSVQVRLAPSTPAAPTISPAQNTNGSYTVSWTAPAGSPTYYELQSATDTAFTTGLATETLSASPKSVTGATDGYRYYRLRACNTVASACSAYGTYGTAYTTLVPGVAGTPTIAPSQSTNGSYTVSWTAPATGTVTTYQLDEATNSAFTTGLSTSSQSTLSKAISGKGNGTYFYRVRACNTTSACAANSSGTPSVLVSLPPSVPTTPTSTESPSLDGSYTINWAAVANATHYVIDESTVSNFASIANSYSPTANTQALTGRGEGVKYYRVKACNTAAACSGYSAALSVNTTLPPGAPASVTLPPSPDTDGSYYVSWGTASGVVSYYTLYEATDAGFATQTAVGSVNDTGLLLSGRTDGTRYYRVLACRNAVGCSGYTTGSGSVTTVLMPSAPGTTGVSPAQSTNGSFTVSWGGASGTVTAYEVQESTSAQFTSPTLVYSGTALSLPISGKGNGAFFYRVRACNTAVACSSYNTYAGIYVTLPPSTPATTSSPATSSTGAYTVSWSAASGTMTSYEVYESNASNFSSQWLVYSGGVATSVNLTSRGSGTYYYRTRACYDIACSGYSSTATTVVSSGPVAPGIPSLIYADPTYTANGIFTVYWGASSGAVTAYELQESIDDPGFASPVLRYTGTGTSKAFNKGSFARTYYYRVRACNGTACSTYRSYAESTVDNGASIGPQKLELVPEGQGEQVADANGAMVPASITASLVSADLVAATVARTRAAALRDPSVTEPVRPLRANPLLQAEFVRRGGVLPTGSATVGFANGPQSASDAFKVQYVYSSYGEPLAVRKCAGADSCPDIDPLTDLPVVEYWRVEAGSSSGTVISERYGNNVVTNHVRDAVTGELQASDAILKHADSSVTPVLTQFFEFDRIGNLMQRSRVAPEVGNPSVVHTQVDTFTYDAINRLTTMTASVDGVAGDTMEYRYDVAGNLVKRDTRAPTITFDWTVAPHAALTATVDGQTRTYGYDGNRNLATVSVAGVVTRRVCWDSSNYAKLIVDGEVSCSNPNLTGKSYSSFAYGPDRSRFKQVKGGGAGTETTVYVGSLFERSTRPSGTKDYVHYVSGGSGVVAQFTRTVPVSGGATDKTEYWHRDHLGSVVAKSNASGVRSNECNYDAWGEQMSCSGYDRGYTGHEHLTNLGLIHMNGRVYDAALGRFMSPDPFLQFPGSTQGFNRFAYVGNNPLSYSDPTGHFWFAVLMWASIAHQTYQSWEASGFKLSGAIGGFMRAGITAAITYGVSTGSYYNGVVDTGVTCEVIVDQASKYMTTGIVSGIAAAASGGRFSDGMKSAANDFMYAQLGAKFGNDWSFKRVVAQSVVGGASAVIRGGDFKQGMQSSFTMAMLHYANRLMRDLEWKTSQQGKGGPSNINGSSVGLDGDGRKLGGGRWMWLSNKWICAAPLGGCQGTRTQELADGTTASDLGEYSSPNVFGWEYSYGDAHDYVVEGYAGPHDFLRHIFGFYDNGYGDSSFEASWLTRTYDKVMNALLVIPATPFAIGGLVPSEMYSRFHMNQSQEKKK